MTATRVEAFAVVIGGQTVAALLFHRALRWRPRARVLAWGVLSALILLAPFAVPPPGKFLRLLASICAVTFVLKLYDLHVGAGRGVRPTLVQTGVFLFNVFSLVQRNLVDQPPPDLRAEARRVSWGAASAACGGAGLFAAFRADWSAGGFWAEHAAKVVAFFLVLVPLVGLLGAAWRAAGLPGRVFMNNPFASRTPADFWRRYNRPVHELLRADVFRGVAGRRATRHAMRHAGLRATLAAFLVSAVVHEYVFAVPVGRVQGYQTAFFLVQGLAVWATLRLKPKGWRAVPWVAATFLFNVMTGVLFFASLNHVVPFYQHRPPLWDE